jgi:hypothetical protein
VSNNASNGSRPPVPAKPDAHGQAAMLLIESLLHGLIERKVLTLIEVVEIVDAAAEVKTEIGRELQEPSALRQQSVALLEAISISLKRDLGA